MLELRSSVADPRDRGLELGERLRQQVQGTVDCYLRMFSAAHGLSVAQVTQVGADLRGRLAPEWSALVTEVDGIAEGAGVDRNLLLAVNARTEVLAGAVAPECTVLARAGTAGPAIAAQNWDWHQDQVDNVVAWTVTTGERGLTTITEAGIVGKIGVNDRGVAVLLNLLPSERVKRFSRAPIHLLLRRVLESADTAAQARDLLMSVPTDASSAVTVVDTSTVACVELSADGHVVLEPVPSGWLVHTNHCRDAPPGPRPGEPGSRCRQAYVEEVTAAAAPTDGPEVAKRVLASHVTDPTSVCAHVAEGAWYVAQQKTLVSVVVDLSSRTVDVAVGNPCETPYRPLVSALQAAP